MTYPPGMNHERSSSHVLAIIALLLTPLCGEIQKLACLKERAEILLRQVVGVWDRDEQPFFHLGVEEG